MCSLPSVVTTLNVSVPPLYHVDAIREVPGGWSSSACTSVVLDAHVKLLVPVNVTVPYDGGCAVRALM